MSNDLRPLPANLPQPDQQLSWNLRLTGLPAHLNWPAGAVAAVKDLLLASDRTWLTDVVAGGAQRLEGRLHLRLRERSPHQRQEKEVVSLCRRITEEEGGDHVELNLSLIHISEPTRLLRS